MTHAKRQPKLVYRLNSLMATILFFAFTGCSLLLEPQTLCDGDDDCKKGSCINGVCVLDDSAKPDIDSDAKVSGEEDMTAPVGGSIAPDAAMTGTDMGPNAIQTDAAVPDMMMPMTDVDMGMPAAPECALALATQLSNESQVQVTITVEDADTDLTALDIQLPGIAVDAESLDRNGEITVTIEGLSEGENLIELVVRDPSGQKCTASGTVVVDTRPPSFQEESLSPPPYVEGRPARRVNMQMSTIMFEGTITDAHFDPDGENAFVIEQNGREIDSDEPVSWERDEDGVRFTYQFAITLDQPAPDIQISLHARDILGNVSEVVPYRYDFNDTPPVIQLTAPDFDATAQNDVRIQATVFERDMVPIEKVARPKYYVTVTGLDAQSSPIPDRFRREPSRGFTTGGGANANAGLIDQVVTLFDGQNRIEICAEDEWENAACASVDVSRLRPRVTIESPRDQSFVATELNGLGIIRLPVTGTVARGVTTVYGFVNSQRPPTPITCAEAAVLEPQPDKWLAPPGGAPMDGHPFQLNLIAPTDGQNFGYFVACTDNENDTAEARVEVTIDNSAPRVVINQPSIDLNSGQATCVGRVVKVCGQVEDRESRVVSMVINDSVIEDLPPEFNGLRDFSQDATCLNIPILEDDRILTITATNGAGQQTTVDIPIIVHVSGPQIDFQETFRDRNQREWFRPNQNRFRLTGTISTAPCRFRSLNMRLDTEVEFFPVNVDGSNFTFIPSNAQLPDGRYTVIYEARDSADNLSADSYSFWIDSTPPELTLVEPAGNVFTQQPSMDLLVKVVDLSGAANGNIGSDVQRVDLLREGANGLALVKALNKTVGDNFGAVIDLDQGLNRFVVEAVDNVGHVTRQNLEIYYDNLPPTVQVLAPLDGAHIPYGVVVEVEAEDPRLGAGTTDVAGSGIAELLVNGVAAIQANDSNRWYASNIPLVLSTNDNDETIATLTITAKDEVDNAIVPIEHTVVISPYARQSAHLEGFISGTEIGVIETVDANGDGVMDIIALSQNPIGQSASYLRNALNRYDSTPIDLPNNYVTQDLAVADLDADGDIDLVITGSTGTSILTNDEGRFVINGANNKTGGADARVFLGDITHNGWADLVVKTSDGVKRYTSNRAAEGQPVFGNNSLVQNDVEADWSQLSNGLFVDLTGDGLLDLVAVGTHGGYLYEGLENGRFTLAADTGDFEHDILRFDGPSSILTFDADQDGDLDIVTYGNNSSVQFYLNDGDQGHFMVQPLGPAWNLDNQFVQVADMNGDGLDDLVFAQGTRIGVWHQTKDNSAPLQAGNSSTPVTYVEQLIDVESDEAITALHVEDVDKDGDFDIIYGTQSGLNLVHSNFSQLHPETHRFLHVWTRRGSKPPASTDEIPNPVASNLTVDGLGSTIELWTHTVQEVDNHRNPDVGPNLDSLDFETQRVLMSRAGGPTLVTFGSETSVPGMSIQVVFADNIQAGGVGDFEVRVPAPSPEGQPEVWQGTEESVVVYDVKQN